MPAKPGESVEEMLAARSSEKARANLNRGTTEEQGPDRAVPRREGPQEEEALDMRLPPTWVANDPENKVPEVVIRAAATFPTPGAA